MVFKESADIVAEQAQITGYVSVYTIHYTLRLTVHNRLCDLEANINILVVKVDCGPFKAQQFASAQSIGDIHQNE